MYTCSMYQEKKEEKYKELGPAKFPCYIRALNNEVPLYCDDSEKTVNELVHLILTSNIFTALI